MMAFMLACICLSIGRKLQTSLWQSQAHLGPLETNHMPENQENQPLSDNHARLRENQENQLV
jgi:hypothetical protein